MSFVNSFNLSMRVMVKKINEKYSRYIINSVSAIAALKLLT